jgi:mannan endo-1,4-beta-mannosidase
MVRYITPIAFIILCTMPHRVAGQTEGFEHFVTASGARLMDGDRELRFISFNIPNLNYIEDEFGFGAEQPYRFPTEFEIRDALESVRQMGGNVVRIYTIPVKDLEKSQDIPTYVLGPGQFNEEAFRSLDLMLAVAREMRVRVIIPFINNWQWMGGRPQYAAFRGKKPNDFWTDPQLIADAKATIAHVVNRVNTVTGIPYKEDKTILCWETGNELQCPHEWTVDICRYIKSLDSNHLIMDGFYAIDQIPVREASLDEPSIDIVSSHHYDLDPAAVLKYIDKNLDIVKGRKPYLLGEFGFISTTAVEQLLDYTIANDIAGALIWSLRFRRREGGFYRHSEPAGHGLYKAYLWPGFPGGEGYDERDLLALMRRKAHEISGAPLLPLLVPAAPVMLPIDNAAHISWQGSAGAEAYDIQRTESVFQPWQTVGYNVSDADVEYFPLFHDATVQVGKSYYYRAIAKNQAGVSAPSNVVGPVKVERHALIDNMRNYGKLYFHTKDVTVATGNDRDFREITRRMKGKAGEELVYFAPGAIRHCIVYSFSKSANSSLEFYLSEDGVDYRKADFDARRLPVEKGAYNYWNAAVYEFKTGRHTGKYLKIVFREEGQIGRVEVYY